MATFEDMRDKHRRDSMLTLCVFLFLLLIFGYHSEYIEATRRLIHNPSRLKAALEDSWLALIMTVIVPIATYFIGIITIAKRDVYYPIDNLIFRRRLRVERFICKNLLKLRCPLTETDKNGIAALVSQLEDPTKRRKVMSLFYRFIEKPDIVNPELKSQAFVYWGDYFSAMMFTAWGVLTFVGCVAIAVFDHTLGVLRIVILFLIGTLVGLSLREILVGKTAKKQFQIPETQISEIHRAADAQLLTDLRAEAFFQFP